MSSVDGFAVLLIALRKLFDTDIAEDKFGCRRLWFVPMIAVIGISTTPTIKTHRWSVNSKIYSCNIKSAFHTWSLFGRYFSMCRRIVITLLLWAGVMIICRAEQATDTNSFEKCPNQCACLGNAVDCSKRKLRNIPDDLPSWTEVL